MDREQNCTLARQHLPTYLENELDPIRGNLVRAHLEDCSECRELAEDLKLERLWLVETLVRSPHLSASFRPAVMAQVRQEARRANRARRARAMGPWLGAAAALMLVALLAAQLRHGMDVSPPDATSRAVAAVERAHQAARERLPAPLLTRDAPRLPLTPEPTRSPVPSVRDAAGEELRQVTSSPARVPSFGHVISFASSLAPRTVPTGLPVEDDPCKPDPNLDGRVDWSDVAYSCQVLVRGAPPDTLRGGQPPEAEVPDCDDHCLRA